MRQIFFHDTTLRDGDQTPGLNFSVSQKVQIARALKAAGVEAIEAGFAAASAAEARAVAAVAEAVGDSCQVTSLARARREDIDAAHAALCGCAKRRVHVFLSTSDLHMKYKLRMTREEVLAAVSEQVAYARTLFDAVEFSAEDATRTDPAFLREVFLRAAAAGADVLNIPDTVGVATPADFGALVRSFAEDAAFSAVRFSVHCHNDLGLAVANTLAGLAAGASQAECTVGGLGERAGNAAFEQVAIALRARDDHYGLTHAVRSEQLIPLARTVSTLSGIPIPVGAPITGANAFSHESGIHQHGMLAHKNTYQILDPEELGLGKPSILLGKLSGRHAFEKKAHELGFFPDREGMERAFASFMQLAERKRLVRDDEVAAILSEVRDAEILSRFWRLTAFSIQSNSLGHASADITLERQGETVRDAATGSGPIEAAFHAVARITKTDFTLDSYRIRAVTEGSDAMGLVQVSLRQGKDTFSGRGVSVDIIEASIKAYVCAVGSALYHLEESAASAPTEA